MKFLVEKCKHWDGSEENCDLERECCVKRIKRLETKGYESCHNKPYEINGERKTITEMIGFIIKPQL